jgi:hypothetical protein
MIPKSGHRFSEKIMLKQQAKAKYQNPRETISLERRIFSPNLAMLCS